MSTLKYEDDSDNSPHRAHSPPCDKCRLTNCFMLHDYSVTDCPLRTCDVCPALAIIEEEISNAQALLFNLAQKRQEIKGKANSRHDCLFNCLPVEIVSHIFKYSAGFNNMHYTRSGKTYTWYPALLLGAVSKSWRDITLGIPHLWTNMEINLWQESARLDVAKEWLCRSRALPLSITFRGINPTVDENLTSLKPILKILRSHSSRWRFPTFNVPPSVLHALLDGLEDIPRVDTLRIDILLDYGTPMEAISMREPLRPREFDTTNFSVAKMSLQWDNLTRLSVFMINVDELVHIIRHGINLTECTAGLLKKDGGDYPLPTTPIFNQSLNHLITNACPDAVNFLHYITLPSLQNFGYSFRTVEQADDILVDFLDRSEARLIKFAAKFHLDGSYPYEPWAERFPAITCLELEIDEEENDQVFETTEAFLEGLACDSDELVLLNLQSLKLRVPWMSTSSWSLFANIFPYPESHDGQMSQNRSRPLRGIKVRQTGGVNVLGQGSGVKMDKDTYNRLLGVQKSGIYLKLSDESGMDILAHAARFYSTEEEHTRDSDTS